MGLARAAEKIQEYRDKKVILGISGNRDSLIVTDLCFRFTDVRPTLVWIDHGVHTPGTGHIVEAIAEDYGAELIKTAPLRSPAQQWSGHGYPVCAYYLARKFNKKNMGLKLNPQLCCQDFKDYPLCRVAKEQKADVAFTGDRNLAQAKKHGSLENNWKKERVEFFSPIFGWTEMMMRRYVRRFDLPITASRSCVFCDRGRWTLEGGLAELYNRDQASWFSVVRTMGEAIICYKFNRPLAIVREAVKRMGGIDIMASIRPEIFNGC